MGIWNARAAAVAVGLSICFALVGAAPALAETGAIAGRVVEAEEIEGVGGTEVCAEAMPPLAAAKACVESEGSGFYEIPGLEPGHWRVHFQPPAESRYLPQYFLHSYSAAGARVLEIEGGSTKSGIGASLEAGGWVTGKVTDATGTALSGIEACVFDRLIPDLGMRCATTNLEGKYEIEHLPPGQYKARFSAPESRSIFAGYFGGASLERDAQEFVVQGYNETPNVDAALELGATIEGSVSEAGSGTPLAGIRVCALAPVSGFEVRCAATRADGRYAIYGLHAGGYVVGFSVAAIAIENGTRIEPEDGFASQYYEDAPAFAGAKVLDASTPGVYGDVDGHLARVSAPGPASAPPAATPPSKHRLCPRHFRRGPIVKGKRRCVPIHHHRRHARARGRH
jgi:hypothetical protein